MIGGHISKQVKLKEYREAERTRKRNYEVVISSNTARFAIKWFEFELAARGENYKAKSFEEIVEVINDLRDSMNIGKYEPRGKRWTLPKKRTKV
jgi:hypothetical protein